MKIYLVKKEDFKVISETTMTCIGELQNVQEIVTERKRPTSFKIEGTFQTVDRYIIEQQRGIIPPQFLRKNRF